MGTLFKNGTIVTASDEVVGDILVEGEVITLIGQSLDSDGHDVVDCTGKYILPGGIDVHTHLDLPFGGTISNDDFDTGHKAAAFGGTTTHIDFVIQPIGGSLADGLKTWRQKADGIAQIDYGFHMAITDLRDEIMDEIPSLLEEGITSLKLFMAYKNVYMIDDSTLYRAMQKAADNGMLVMVHAENGDVEALLTPQLIAEGKTDPIYHASSRPPEIEGEATNRAIVMSGMTGCPLYIVHMTCEESIDAIRRGRSQGAPVMGETCVQYFFLTVDEHLGAPGYEGSKFVCSPPIRSEKDHAILWKAVQDGTLQHISTDHCDFWYEGGVGPWKEWMEAHNGTDWVGYEKQDPSYRRPGKELGKGNFSKIPNGMPGIEDRMMVIWEHGVNTGRLSPTKFVELMSTNPAKIFGMYPKKGTIAIGSDADLLIWDPEAKHTISAETHHMRVDYNCYEGMTVTGKPVMVYQRGKKLVDGDEWLGQNGAGEFIKRKPHAPVL
ncbi:dihydropyrimidinase [Phototrophicus methaneseepsis]|uniref:D-hydantoinase n=1 Tax=Phototrophicus methaneseepsis TaxID=2710758 RepID=A0A7S8EBC7_9CHLR|nr:dihydropyrimidinase [Phototrophicus methaneseepsis]QPC83831.1 dihydropyrimidinase [Phototrophicus methaneseepsis]